MLKINGWTRDYVMSDRDVEIYTDVVLKVLVSNYTTDDGATTFQGQSLSHVVSELRYARCKVPSNLTDQHNLLEALGFKIVKARGERWYRGGKRGFGNRCDCVTV